MEAEATTAVEVEAAAASATTKAAASTGEFTLMLLHFVRLLGSSYSQFDSLPSTYLTLRQLAQRTPRARRRQQRPPSHPHARRGRGECKVARGDEI